MPDPKLRVSKVALAVLHEPDPAVAALFLTHPSVRVRESAIAMLERSPSPEAERHLLAFIASSDDRYLVPRVNARLSKGASAAAIPVLANLVHHRVEDIKASAINALRENGDASTTDVYLDALSDRSWVAKAYAMHALADHGDLRAMDIVIERLKAILSRDRSDNVLGDTEVVYALKYLWRWRDDERARHMLSWVGSERRARLKEHERTWLDEHARLA